MTGTSRLLLSEACSARGPLYIFPGARRWSVYEYPARRWSVKSRGRETTAVLPMHESFDLMDTQQDTAPLADSAATSPRCRRCRKVISSTEQEIFFLRTGLCFWCAYVDSQG